LANGILTQRYTTTKGKSLARGLKAQQKSDEIAERSFAALEHIKNDVMLLEGAGVPDGKYIISAQPDDRNNRVIVTINRRSDRLISALATLYGTKAVAIRVDTDARRARRMLDRYSDIAPYSGGAYFRPPGTNCTLGFPWSEGFVTAGHCIPNGGASYIENSGSSGPEIGRTYFGDENWSKGIGTVAFPGQTWPQGDIALIRQGDRSKVNAQILVGSPQSYEKRWVTGVDYPGIGDRFCTGGANTGELCDWQVVETRVNAYYDDDSDGDVDAVVLDMTRGLRVGQDLIGGDSGGPVYAKQPDGTVWAMGIISGSGPYGGYIQAYFTDIGIVENSLPGALRQLTGPAYIVNDNSWKCLAIANGSKTKDANAIQWDCTGSTAQQFYMELHPLDSSAIRIINAGSGLCLSVAGSSLSDGARIHQWDCANSSFGQTWLYGQNGSLVNKSGKCMAIGSGSKLNGANAIQWTCTGSPAQKWNWFWLD
jgi:hypothetical protein